jgi:hypothetical protein
MFKSAIPASEAKFREYSPNGHAIISIRPVYMEGYHGTSLQDLPGSHAMTTVGTDNGLVVWSWGREYLVDPNHFPVPGNPGGSYAEFQVIRYYD